MLKIRMKIELMPIFRRVLEAVSRKARMVPDNHASSNTLLFFGYFLNGEISTWNLDRA